MLAVFITACGSGAGLGRPCQDSSDCASDYQCLRQVCTLPCQADLECGDGYICSDSGDCSQVQSQIGDGCARELECGPGQACRLDATDVDADGVLGATCQVDLTGAELGRSCQVDLDCRSGTCALGACTSLCSTDGDCPGSFSCVTIPRPLAGGGAPVFTGCLPSEGTLSMRIPVTAAFAQVRVPVPSHARSFSLITSISEEGQLVGVAELHAPSGQQLYATPHSPDEVFQNPIRYQPAPRVSTMLVPNTNRVALETGVYDVALGSFSSAGGAAGTAIPEVEVIYKLDDAAVLDLNFIFLNLDSHPCASELANGALNAELAQSSSLFQSVYLARLRTIFVAAGITIGEVHYQDILSRPDLDGLETGDLDDLLRMSTRDQGVNIFFVRSIAPAGIEALAGAAPGPPGLSGTAASGIAVSLDTLCYRDWNTLARVTAHQIGKHLGLFRNREPDGKLDPIDDSNDQPDNLMFYSDFGGTVLSSQQQQVLRLNPTLRRPR